MISPQKTPKGTIDNARSFGQSQGGLRQVTKSPMLSSTQKSAPPMPFVQVKEPDHPARIKAHDRSADNSVGKSVKSYYANHEIQRYSRCVDADEEGIRQEAQSSLAINMNISQAITCSPSLQNTQRPDWAKASAAPRMPTDDMFAPSHSGHQ